MADLQPESRRIEIERLNFSLLSPPPCPGRKQPPLSTENMMFLVVAACQQAGINLTRHVFLNHTHLVRVAVERREPGDSGWEWKSVIISDDALRQMYGELQRVGHHEQTVLPSLFTEILGKHGYTLSNAQPPSGSPSVKAQPDLFRESA